jgi:hypothetical protein
MYHLLQKIRIVGILKRKIITGYITSLFQYYNVDEIWFAFFFLAVLY